MSENGLNRKKPKYTEIKCGESQGIGDRKRGINGEQMNLVLWYRENEMAC